jgi:hypothetical protein
MSSETGGGGGGGAPRMCVECNVRVAQAIVAVDNARRLCCMECVARLKAERKSRGQKPNNNNAAAAAAAVAAANANNGANGVANGAVNATNAVPDDKLCQRCRVNVRQAKVCAIQRSKKRRRRRRKKKKENGNLGFNVLCVFCFGAVWKKKKKKKKKLESQVVLRGESILACGECVRALSSQAKEAKEKEKSDAAAAAAAAVPAPGAPAAAPAAAPSAEDKAKLCEKCGLRPRKAKVRTSDPPRCA